MKNQITAIVLGGVVSHIPLITKLQKRGYYVVLVDYLDNPPAKRYANEHVQISTFDEEAIYSLALESNAAILINGCLEYLNVIIARLSKRLGLPCLYPEAVALDVSDKARMKAKMVESNIPTSKYLCLTDCQPNSFDGLHYPLFVKPADSSGSNGVNRVKSQFELKSAFDSAKKFSKSGLVIVEEEAKGLECNAYCYVLNGEANVLLISSKYSEINNAAHSNTKCISTYAPAPISFASERAIANVAQRIATAFSLQSTPMFMQLMVSDADVSVIEFACRIPGGYSYRSIINKLGFDYFDFLLDVLLGECKNPDISDTGEISLVHSFYAYPGILDRVEGFEKLVADGTIVDINIARERGSIFSEESCNREKVGHFVVAAGSSAEAIDKVNVFFNNIKVIDMDGVDIMRHDLRLSIDQISK